jgi:hypothetical protein
MTAREIDEAAATLRELRVQTVGDLALAGAAFAVALVASRLFPTLAVPMLIGAVAMTVLGLRAFVHRSFLVEDLAGQADAYALRDVRRYAARAASAEHRRSLAHALRARLHDPELLALIAVLEDEKRTVDPQTVVSLERSLYAAAPVEELRCRLRRLADR